MTVPLNKAREEYEAVQFARTTAARQRIAELLAVQPRDMPMIDHLESIITIALDNKLGLTLSYEQLVCICRELREGSDWRSKGRKLAEALAPFVRR